MSTRKQPAAILAAMEERWGLTAPHGTASAHLDYDRGVLRIFAELDPHPDDWKWAQEIASLAGGSWDFLADGEVDVFEVRIA